MLFCGIRPLQGECVSVWNLTGREEGEGRARKWNGLIDVDKDEKGRGWNEEQTLLTCSSPNQLQPLANSSLITCPASMLPSDIPRLKRVSKCANTRSQRNSAIMFERRALTDFVDEGNNLSALWNEWGLGKTSRRGRTNLVFDVPPEGPWTFPHTTLFLSLPWWLTGLLTGHVCCWETYSAISLENAG